ncbi:hypothetical protein KAI87_11070, partial [Myxococcota bacterium]|nr:hypothetical protein [Myxococcota bacterium]
MRNSRLSRSSLSGNHSPQASRWSVALGILLLAGQLACGSTPGESDIKKDNDTNILNDHIDLPGNNTDDIVQLATAKQLISDPNFTNGFITQDPISGADIGRINPTFSGGTPVWRLGQWGRANNIGVLNDFSSVCESSECWDDFKGSVTIGAPGSGEADLSLRVNAYEEYQGNYYPYAGSRSTWVHLIAEQGITPLTDYPDEGCPALSRLSSLNFSVDARLLCDNQNQCSGYDAGKHAADYYVYFTIQNRNAAKAAGYGDYVWFGLTLYGDRDPSPGLYVNGDDFTQKLIYNIGYEPLADQDLTDGTWRHLQEDLLPHMKSALQAAWDRGYLPDSRNLEDYRIGGMNIG